MVAQSENVTLQVKDDENTIKLEDKKYDPYSPALGASENVKSEVNNDYAICKKEEDLDTKADLKLEAKLETPSIMLDATGIFSETTSTIFATEGFASDLELAYPSTPQSQDGVLPVAHELQPSSSPLDLKPDVKMEGEVKVEAVMKAEVQSQPGHVKVEMKLEGGDDTPLNPLKEEEGVKGEIKDEAPPIAMLDLPQTPTNEQRASIEHPECHAAAGLPLDSPMDLAATDSLPDIPAADVGELVDPAIKPKPTDSIDLETVPAPVSRRKFMLCVEVPSLESVMKRYKKWEQTIVKKPKKEAAISLKTLAGRYEALGVREPYHIPLDIEIRDTPVSRQLISSIYGGNVQQIFPTPSAKFLAIHGLDDFMFLNYIMHPNAPTLAGAPGFFFSSRSGDPIIEHMLRTKIMRIFIQIAPLCWMYFGHYQFVMSDALSPQEWLAQSPQFRRQWVNEIMIRKGWKLKIRCKVLLRIRLGRLPTDEELDDALKTPGFSQEVTADDIYESFARGDHFITVWGMKCVGYDTAFQERLVAAKQAAVAKEDVEENRDRKPKVTKRKGRAASPDFLKKRVRKDSPSDPEGDSKPLKIEVDNDTIEIIEQPPNIVKNDDDDGGVQIVEGPVLLKKKIYTPQGTRSRPASAKVIIIN